MRLFDKCVSQLQGWRDDLHSVEAVLNVDAIASHVYLSPKMQYLPNDLPFCRPPWNKAFVEWNVPKLMNCDGAMLPTNDADQAGIACYTTAVDANQGWIERLLPAFEYNRTESSQAHWLIAGRFFGFSGGRVSDANLVWVAALDRNGQYLASASVGPDASLFMQAVINYKPIILLAFNFLNCKNVTLEDVTDDLQPEPKIRRRLKIPEVKRYTLNIAGHVVRPSRDYNQGPQGVMPFHLCRGHFATYTEEKKLFGKYTGRFWIPPHMKGKKENGEIVKDYEIAHA